MTSVVTLFGFKLLYSRMRIRLQNTDGQYMIVLFSPMDTIATVLQHCTPASLENANPVIVVDGRVAMLDMFFGDFHTNATCS